jgi:hypothetical protein
VTLAIELPALVPLRHASTMPLSVSIMVWLCLIAIIVAGVRAGTAQQTRRAQRRYPQVSQKRAARRVGLHSRDGAMRRIAFWLTYNRSAAAATFALICAACLGLGAEADLRRHHLCAVHNNRSTA